VRILTDDALAADPRALDAAWDAPGLFALVPTRDAGDPRLARALARVPPDVRDGGSDAFAPLTSGSTGRPKLVVGLRTRAAALARALHAAQELDAVGEAIVALPLTYSYAFVNQWVWAKTHSRRLVLTRGFARADELAFALENARDALVCLVGAQVPLLDALARGRAFEGVARVCFAGGRFPSERLGVVRRAFPRAAVFNNYGCAEAMPRLTLRRAERSADATKDAPDDATNIGWPLPSIAMRADETGALLFRSPFGAIGWVEDETWHPVTPDGPGAWVPTGDLGAIEADGSVRLFGRAGEVFKRHGEKVSLLEMSRAFPRMLRDATPPTASKETEGWSGDAALYREDDAAGEPGYALALAPPPDQKAIWGLLTALRRYPRAHWPLRIESIDVLPRLPSGKIDGAAMRDAPNKTVHWFQRIGSTSS
jgi:acyl-CoA synthetase (AMP-forming)/AMP-acid ligase II